MLPPSGMVRSEETYTLTLYGGGAGDTFNIIEADSVLKVSVASFTPIDGAIEMISPKIVGGKVSTAIPIKQGTPVTITPFNGSSVLDGIKISVPAGGQLAIICQR